MSDKNRKMVGIILKERLVAFPFGVFDSVSVYKIRLSVCGVLIYSDKLLVFEDSHCVLVGFSEVTADNERRTHHCPECKVSFVFLNRTAFESDVASAFHSDNEHIHIVETAAAVVFGNLILGERKLLYGLPCVVYVAR